MWFYNRDHAVCHVIYGYAIYYYRNPDAFHESAKALNTIGAVNTVILLLSSFTVAWAIEAIKKEPAGQRIVNHHNYLGVVFLVNKYFEYAHEIHIGNLIPSNFGTGEPVVPTMFFFILCDDIHGLHILIGLGLLFWVLAKNMNGDFHSGWYTPVEMGGLYWHLVDLIWIYLFPLLYLVA